MPNEHKEFDVTVTITFSTNVIFAKMGRIGPITKQDALDNFYGMGLSCVLDSGEYGYSVDNIQVSDTTDCQEIL